MPAHLPGLQYDLAAEPVPCLEGDLVGIDHHTPMGQVIEAGGSVPPDLVLDEGLVGIGSEDVEGVGLGPHLGLQAGQAPAVTGQLRDRQIGVEIAEQGIELSSLDLQVQLFRTRRLVILVRLVAVQRIVGVRIDGRMQAVADLLLVFPAVEGHGEEPLPFDPPLGEERHPPIAVEVLLDIGVLEALHVSADRVVAHSALRQANQDPVPGGGVQPGGDLPVASPQHHPHRGHSGPDRGSQSDQGDAVLTHGETGISPAGP